MLSGLPRATLQVITRAKHPPWSSDSQVQGSSISSIPSNLLGILLNVSLLEEVLFSVLNHHVH